MDLSNISLNTHSSIKITGKDGIVLYCDPYEITEAAQDADLILLTHDHYDHFDPKSVEKVMKADTAFIVPESVQNSVSEVAGDRQVIPLKAGQRVLIDGVSIQAVAAYNLKKQYHPKAKGWLGYLITLDQRVYYIAGDTDALPENTKFQVDVALVPIGGTFTMDAKEAADFVNALCPKAVIPVHYGTVAGKPEDADHFEAQVNACIPVVRKLFV
ncbi:MBL fold metallo-hydrolase [Pseudoramibacter sp.]|jgi:L-ascorbate metabolism protein UlaG (beta-lactamase superfamily)|uniref:MBL fold metallo-hydrolase n=1 Tax=Pseudoramibacter sp. TaxID=2034862 RepID=UPI0025F777FF|nr:MBL fold metallo-hydrolase [Pseudoramibacter sp.]MCH4072230.1 MBL fold metallo-hydrolase [Pseudoramibacter sp.]MCH4106000.1 MBL fold metallo-hydrolase [Pseudoramibacter sp.]